MKLWTLKVIHVWPLETGDLPEGGDPESPEVAGGDARAGETDEDVQKLPDRPGDLQPAQKLQPGPRLQTHPPAGLQRAQGGGKDVQGCTHTLIHGGMKQLCNAEGWK